MKSNRFDASFFVDNENLSTQAALPEVPEVTANVPAALLSDLKLEQKSDVDHKAPSAASLASDGDD